MKTSTKDKIKGSIHEVKGTIREEVGTLTNDRDLKAEGNTEKRRASSTADRRCQRSRGKVEGTASRVKNRICHSDSEDWDTRSYLTNLSV